MFDLGRPRTRQTGVRLGESLFTWIDQSASASATRLRQSVNSLLETYPRQQIDEMDARIRASDDVVSEGALFELFVHGWLRSAGFAVSAPDPEPGLSSPDYLINTPKDVVLAIEATVVRDDPDWDVPSARQLVNDAALLVTRRDYRVHIEHLKWGMGGVSARELARHFDDAAHAVLGKEHDQRAFARTDEVIRFDHDSGCVIEYEVWSAPLRPEGRSALLGIGGEGLFVPTAHAIRTAVKGKLRQHRARRELLVVAIGCSGPMHSAEDVDVIAALIGTNQWHYRKNSAGESEEAGQSRAQDGLWHSARGDQTSPYALMVATSANPLELSDARVTLWDNPWTDSALTLEPWPFERRGWHPETGEHLRRIATVRA